MASEPSCGFGEEGAKEPEAVKFGVSPTMRIGLRKLGSLETRVKRS